MRGAEYYEKHKIRYKPMTNPLLDKRYRWQTFVVILVVALIGPFFAYRRLRIGTFSFGNYLQLVEYFLMLAVPFMLWLFWLNRREVIKQERGYHWVGKFEVTGKYASFLFCHLKVMPGDNKLRVERKLFDSIREGDHIVVSRDALGVIEEIKKWNNISTRLTKSNPK